MDHIMVTGDERDYLLRQHVFQRIAAGNTILLLGAGASITDDKRYLSEALMAYHRTREGFDLETMDITDYVDTLSKNPRFDRRTFDDQVAQYLRDLNPSHLHSIIARLPWKEIITTNYDLLIERAYDQLHGKADELQLLKVVRSREEYTYRPAADEVVYVKLNGCVSDRSRYPLVFSSRDFDEAKPFYKVVLQALENLSPHIQFLAVGYSFRDPFAQSLLKRFDSFNFRNRRELLLVDPGIQEARLPALAEQGIRVINASSSEFFSAYEAWEDESSETTLRRRRVTFIKSDSQRMHLSPRLAKRLSQHIVQLGSGSTPPVNAQNFYKGERPTFYVIEKGYDVVRTGLLTELASGVRSALLSQELILPIVALTGGYGTGKSTLGYRLVYDLLHSDLDLLAFDVVEPIGLRSQDIRELLERSGAENVLFLFDECEVDSSYKALVELQADLSALQVPGLHIAFIVPIRENILQKFQSRRSISSLADFRTDAPLNRDEVTELLNRLEGVGLVQFGDVAERDRKATEAIEKYDGDPFVTLLTLVTDGQHDITLRHAYEQLSPASRRAFLLTSLLYRHKLYMPASLLMRLVSSDWDAFKRDVMEVDTKGILIQVQKTVKGTDPDLYFRTRHAVLSDLLVRMVLPTPDSQFTEYRKILRKMHMSPYSSRLVVDLLKGLRADETFSDPKIGALFDACAGEFAADPHFNLHYAINLQYRDTEESIKKGLERLIYAEGFLERRNHRLTHRRAVLNFRLAQMLHEIGRGSEAVGASTGKARELFEIKLIEDPFSSYSFVEYLRFEIWCLEHVAIGDEQRARSMVKISDLFDKAQRRLIVDRDKVASIEASYRSRQRTLLGGSEYADYIQRLYCDPDLKPYALILRYYEFAQQHDTDAQGKVVKELEAFTHLDEVVKLLFGFYGRNLYLADHRVKLFDLVRKHDLLLRQERARYHYFMAVAAAYNRRFHDFYEHLNSIRAGVGPGLRVQEVWRNADGEPEVFSGRPFKQKGRKLVRVVELQRYFPIWKRGSVSDVDFSGGRTYSVSLKFSLTGIWAILGPGA